jgi:GT2 family glycosyltransferase
MNGWSSEIDDADRAGREIEVAQEMTDRSCDVVITTRNRATALRRSLDGLRTQSVDGFGVIIVDDCSEEPMSSALGSDAGNGLDVTHLRLAAPSGPAAGRNAGVAASTADLIVFIDDDVVPNRRFIEAHVGAVAPAAGSAAPVVSCGPFLQPADWSPTPWNLWEARAAKKEADNLMRGVFDVTWRQFHTGNNCLPRADFNAVGGFDESFKRSEDDELALRLHERGCVFHFEPEAIAWHYSMRSIESWLAIPRMYAHFDVEIDRLHPDAGYLADKKRELGTRRLPLRVVRRVLAGPRRSRLGVAAAVGAAEQLYKVGAVDAAMGALSVAYDLSYVDSLRQSERQRPSEDVGQC